MRCTEFGGVRQHGCDQVAWRDLDAANHDRLGRVEPELVQRGQHLEELVAEAVLERDSVDVDPARHQQHLFVLDVDALQLADALGEREQLGLGERLGREPAAVAFVDDRRIEALLDRRPDAERRGKGEALDHQVVAVAHADLVNRREQVVGRRSGRDIGEARLDTHADECEQPALGPGVAGRELGSTEADAELVMGIAAVWR